MNRWYRCDGIERSGVVDVLASNPTDAAREYAIDACEHDIAEGDVTVVVTGEVPKNFQPFGTPKTFRFNVARVMRVECREVNP